MTLEELSLTAAYVAINGAVSGKVDADVRVPQLK